MERHTTKRVPVVRYSRLVDLVSRGNLLQALADDRIVRERLTNELQAQSWAHPMTKNIVVENGVVHLSGFARTEKERRALRGVPSRTFPAWSGSRTR